MQINALKRQKFARNEEDNMLSVRHPYWETILFSNHDIDRYNFIIGCALTIQRNFYFFGRKNKDQGIVLYATATCGVNLQFDLFKAFICIASISQIYSLKNPFQGSI